MHGCWPVAGGHMGAACQHLMCGAQSVVGMPCEIFSAVPVRFRVSCEESFMSRDDARSTSVNFVGDV